MADGLNGSDVPGKDLAYVVLRKGNRLQVIVRPTVKQLRDRGKRNWQVVAAAPGGGAAGPVDPADALRAATLDALAELIGDAGKVPNGKKGPSAMA